VVEQHAVAGVHAIRLAVINSYPVGVQLRNAVGAAGIEGGGFLLWGFLNKAIQLTGAGLINAGFFSEPEHPHRFKDAQRPESIAVGGVLRGLKTDSHVTLGTKVINLIRLHLLNDADQIGAVSEIAVVKNQPGIILMGVLIQVINTTGVEAAGSALDPVHLIALLEQKLSEVAAILACDPSDQRLFHGWNVSQASIE